MAILKTRGTQRGSLNYGPRGARQSFVNVPIKDNTGFRNFQGGGMSRGGEVSRMSVSQYVMGLVSVGVLFYVIGYSYAEGKKAA
jgi:hypothetical protein|tara:strand:- start:5055 stop:5306 length:252 start_codon:yes stop_codon:yes gene_type:complete